MLIDGRLIAEDIKKDLKKKVLLLRNKNIIPHLAVVLVGVDPGSLVYIKQKEKIGEELGVKISNIKFKILDRKEEIIKKIKSLNNDKSVHGIIIQRPVPLNIGKEELDRLVSPEKDVDGFHPDTRFTPPIALAVLNILKYVSKSLKEPNFKNWLVKKKILVIGRGETAGLPIADYFKKTGIKITVAHSQTNNLKKLCSTADIIVSCIGKPEIVRQDMVTNRTIIIGVGLHTEDGKLQADYNQQQIASKVAFYTPVPGGVGPVNVACLMENLVLASEGIPK